VKRDKFAGERGEERASTDGDPTADWAGAGLRFVDATGR